MISKTELPIEAEETAKRPAAHSPPAIDLIETLKSVRATAGDGLSDEEFTFFAREKHLPGEAGFHFLCFHKGCATFSVPPQDCAAWHPENRWISPEKEKIAAGLAKKYSLMLSEPPDAALKILIPVGVTIHHHLELSNRKETIIVAHPEFLKIRLFSSDKNLVFPPMPGLLKDLAGLYQANLLTDLAAHLPAELRA